LSVGANGTGARVFKVLLFMDQQDIFLSEFGIMLLWRIQWTRSIQRAYPQRGQGMELTVDER
jgi:hypothetical protein